VPECETLGTISIRMGMTSLSFTSRKNGSDTWDELNAKEKDEIDCWRFTDYRNDEEKK
jgi:hypothetical protein